MTMAGKTGIFIWEKGAYLKRARGGIQHVLGSLVNSMYTFLFLFLFIIFGGSFLWGKRSVIFMEMSEILRYGPENNNEWWEEEEAHILIIIET